MHGQYVWGRDLFQVFSGKVVNCLQVEAWASAEGNVDLGSTDTLCRHILQLLDMILVGHGLSMSKEIESTPILG